MMEAFAEVLASLRPDSLVPFAILLLATGSLAVAWPAVAPWFGRSEIRRRLKIGDDAKAASSESMSRAGARAVRERVAKTAQDFYLKTDPENVARLRMRLMQAGFLDPRAVGMFFLIRFVSLVVMVLAAILLEGWFAAGAGATSRWVFVLISGAAGYFVPGLVLLRLVAVKMREYRNGFPDFMDLMIVCADAGMSMEASIERVSKEMSISYPSLSQNLQLMTIELRAGRTLEDTLRSLAERLSLDEVRSFATLLQQSKELGTSLSGALRVFSDEMRHKRMSIAEEKAHALPAKMSVPVVVCILPVVLMIAVIPLLVKFSAGE